MPNVVPAWTGFLGAVTGMNGAGITVGEMGSSSKDESFEGVAMIFLVREVLRRATDLEAAIDVFRRGPRTCGFNFIVGSGDERRAAAIEVTRSKMFVSGLGDAAEAVPPHAPIDGAVRRSNHFVGPELAATQRDPYDPRQSAKASWAL